MYTHNHACIQVGHLEAKLSAAKADNTKQKQLHQEQTRQSRVICSVVMRNCDVIM